MRKTFKTRIAMTMAAVMVLLLTACDSGNVGTAGTTEPAVTEAPTPEVVEATEVAEPTEEATPEVTEEPTPEVVNEDPNIIRGFDFTPFNTGEKTLAENFEMLSGDKLMFVIGTDPGIIGIAFDGESYSVSAEEEIVIIDLYTPKPIKSKDSFTAEVDESVININCTPHDGEGTHYEYLIGMCFLKGDPTFENEEVTVTVTYEDDTTETITANFSYK